MVEPRADGILEGNAGGHLRTDVWQRWACVVAEGLARRKLQRGGGRFCHLRFALAPLGLGTPER